jgi:hypothetical protein
MFLCRGTLSFSPPANILQVEVYLTTFNYESTVTLKHHYETSYLGATLSVAYSCPF